MNIGKIYNCHWYNEDHDMGATIPLCGKNGKICCYENCDRIISAGNSIKNIRALFNKRETLEDKHWDECRQIANYDNDLKCALKLLSEALGKVSTEWDEAAQALIMAQGVKK